MEIIGIVTKVQRQDSICMYTVVKLSKPQKYQSHQPYNYCHTIKIVVATIIANIVYYSPHALNIMLPSLYSAMIQGCCHCYFKGFTTVCIHIIESCLWTFVTIPFISISYNSVIYLFTLFFAIASTIMHLYEHACAQKIRQVSRLKRICAY